DVPMDAVRHAVAEAIRTRRPVLTTVAAEPATELLLAVPAGNAADSGSATVVAVAPKSRLIRADPFNRLLGLEAEPEGEPPYTLQLTPLDPSRPAPRRTWARSYRLRLTIGLFAFFVIPALAFAVWSYQRLASEAEGGQDVLVRETLRDVTPVGPDSAWLEQESSRLKTPLVSFSAGELRDASDPLLTSLAPVGRFLREDVGRLLVIGDEESVSRALSIGAATVLFGFRSIDRPGRPDLVIAAPAGPE